MSDKKERIKLNVLIANENGQCELPVTVHTRQQPNGGEKVSVTPYVTAEQIRTYTEQLSKLINPDYWTKAIWKLLVDAIRSTSLGLVEIDGENARVNVEELSKRFTEWFAPAMSGKKLAELLEQKSRQANNALREFFEAHPDCINPGSPHHTRFVQLLKEAMDAQRAYHDATA